MLSSKLYTGKREGKNHYLVLVSTHHGAELSWLFGLAFFLLSVFECMKYIYILIHSVNVLHSTGFRKIIDHFQNSSIFCGSLKKDLNLFSSMILSISGINMRHLKHEQVHREMSLSIVKKLKAMPLI